MGNHQLVTKARMKRSRLNNQKRWYSLSSNNSLKYKPVLILSPHKVLALLSLQLGRVPRSQEMLVTKQRIGFDIQSSSSTASTRNTR